MIQTHSQKSSKKWRLLLSSSHLEKLSKQGINRPMNSLDGLKTHSQFSQKGTLFTAVRILSSMTVWLYVVFLFFPLNCHPPTPTVGFLKISYTEQIFIKHLNKHMNKLQLHGPTKSEMETIHSLQVPT